MKKLYLILPVALILCFMVGCQDKEAKAELDAVKAQAEIEEQNKALVKRMFEAWEKGDFEAYKEVVAPEFVWHNPSSSTRPMSREETIKFGMLLHSAFPDITFSIEELMAVEDRVITRFIIRGTHEGEFQGIPATGNKIEHSGIMITRIDNGKIVEEREEVDRLGVMMQIGMELRPKKIEK
jgi:steroid delta-isomerase-like uncharacterized protein